MLIPLIHPPTVPLWQVAHRGAAFGVVIGKEIFGGTGMNFLNPALTARAFLFFAYPASALRHEVWIAATPADAKSGATWLASLGRRARDISPDFTWMGRLHWANSRLHGGNLRARRCCIGAVLLLITRIGRVANNGRCAGRHARDRRRAEPARREHQPHARCRSALAPAPRRVGVWCGIHGHRPGVVSLHVHGQAVLRRLASGCCAC
jgi:hypothetical protein